MLRTSVFPSRYLQGQGAIERLDAELSTFGARAACLVDPAVQGFIQPVIERLSDVAAAIRIADGACTLSAIADTCEWAASTGADMLVALGGGKVIDTGRAAADELGLPFICVPTIAASDAPCSGLAVIYDNQGRVVEDRFVRRNPALVLVDTQILVRAPVRFFISGIGDALATWYEADACRQSGAGNLCGGRGTSLAYTAAGLCRDTLLAHGVQAVQDCRAQRVTTDFEEAIEACVLLSGLGFESGGVGAAHAIHHGLADLPQTHEALHGEKVAIGLLTSLFLSQRSLDERLQLFAFCRDTGLPVTLAQVGVDVGSEEQLVVIAQRACRSGEIIHNEPYVVTWQAVVSALRAMDQFGRETLSRSL